MILAAYITAKESPAGADWKLELGEANIRLFKSPFSLMFTRMVFFAAQPH
ncbi:MAG: hypothetical protein ACI80M_001527 [Gammaproteobacteria bacterium]|jgi:hypothetical protein|tara:strand:+ start:571 stop:720 length:150 start_codon:yes stop_codon:yes gene_type:complete